MVSVVTPFYNTAAFLGDCIESVLRQTYADWEYVLVDNRSTDGSGEIADQYASRFPGRIRVVHADTFRNQVQNYNFSLTCISPESKYCKMVQADDWIFPDCIRSMVEVAERHPSVGLVAAYRIEGDEVSLDGIPYPVSMLSGREACRLYFLKGRYVFGSPTSTLVRSEVVRSGQPFFEERYAPFEDGHAYFYALRSWDFGFVHQLLTYSRTENGGIMCRVRGFGLGAFLPFTMLAAHGRNSLSEDEFRTCMKRAEQNYFLQLTQSACSLHRLPSEYWEFHRQGLASVNYSYDWKRFMRWLPRALIQKAWDAFWRRWDGDYSKDFRFTVTPQGESIVHHQKDEESRRIQNA